MPARAKAVSLFYPEESSRDSLSPWRRLPPSRPVQPMGSHVHQAFGAAQLRERYRGHKR
jgi:hypothetical protein